MTTSTLSDDSQRITQIMLEGYVNLPTLTDLQKESSIFKQKIFIDAYNKCATLHDKVNLMQRYTAKMLIAFMRYAMEIDAQYYIAKEINMCLNHKTLAALATIYDVGLLLLRSPGPTPELKHVEAHARASFEEHEQELMSNFQYCYGDSAFNASKKLVMERDGNRCIITGLLSSTSQAQITDRKAKLQSIIEDPTTVAIEYAHIFPQSWNQFDPDESEEKQIKKITTLAPPKRPRSHSYQVMRPNKEYNFKHVTFTSPDVARLPPPDPRFLALHGNLAQIAHSCGFHYRKKLAKETFLGKSVEDDVAEVLDRVKIVDISKGQFTTRTIITLDDIGRKLLLGANLQLLNLQKLQFDDVLFKNEKSVADAYSLCLWLEEKYRNTPMVIMMARILGYLMIEAPTVEGCMALSRDILFCRQSGPGLVSVAILYLVSLIHLSTVTVHKHAATTKGHEAILDEMDLRQSFEDTKCQISMLYAPPSKTALTRSQAIVLNRDENRCLATKKGPVHFNAKEIHNTKDLLNHVSLPNDDHNQYAHIIPQSLNLPGKTPDAEEKKKKIREMTWTVIYRYSGIDMRTEFLDDNIHKPSNLMTLSEDVHHMFDCLQLCFEAVPNAPHTYCIRTTVAHRLNGKVVDFRRQPTVDESILPDPRYLRLHERITKVAQYSGFSNRAAVLAGAFDDEKKSMEDIEEMIQSLTLSVFTAQEGDELMETTISNLGVDKIDKSKIEAEQKQAVDN
ncbi:hypothetical protein CVT24_008125 [Panaeolus cyanescens]|uniref:HNH nuclease domain-containing protein n=1 Tax=Panaeolus cyanescens TaxID=181874 RepID=A0A409YMT5_9AGAR|nr:hypothetical protein CVT24_008125 [Panaeolus cyanescens]